MENLSEFEVCTVSEILGLLTQVTIQFEQLCVCVRACCVCAYVHMYRRINAHSCLNIVVSQTR